MLTGNLTQALQIAGCRSDGSRIAHDGLEDDARDKFRMGLKSDFEGREVVVGQRQRVHDCLVRYAC